MAVDIKVAQPVRVDLVLLIGFATVRFWIDGLKAHLAHQTMDSLVIDGMLQVMKSVFDTPYTVVRLIQMNLINQAHQQEVILADWLRFAVKTRTGNVQRLALLNPG